MNQANNDLLTIHEIASYLKVKVSTVYAWIHQKRIPFLKIGRLVRFNLNDIVKWTEDKQVKVYDYEAQSTYHLRSIK